MIDPDRIDPVLREIYGVHYVLMAGAGIDPEHIFILPICTSNASGQDTCGVIVEDGAHTYSISCGRPLTDADVARWVELIEEINRVDQETRRAIVEGTLAREKAAYILAGLAAAGFEIWPTGPIDQATMN